MGRSKSLSLRSEIVVVVIARREWEIYFSYATVSSTTFPSPFPSFSGSGCSICFSLSDLDFRPARLRSRGPSGEMAAMPVSSRLRHNHEKTAIVPQERQIHATITPALRPRSERVLKRIVRRAWELEEV